MTWLAATLAILGAALNAGAPAMGRAQQWPGLRSRMERAALVWSQFCWLVANSLWLHEAISTGQLALAVQMGSFLVISFLGLGAWVKRWREHE